MQSQSVFTFAYRSRMICHALLGIVFGAGMIFLPYWLFGVMMFLLPYGVWAAGLWQIVKALKLHSQRKNYVRILLCGLLLVAGAGLVFWKFQWRDIILWYLFTLYLLYSAYQVWRPVRARGVAKQIFWRSLGSLTAAGFAVLLLLKPRSGLSEALTLLGGFLIAWGIFQLLLPAPRE